MPTALRVPPPARTAARPARRTAMVAGGLYLATFVTSIPTLVLYAPLRDPDFALGAGSSTTVLWGAFLEVALALSCAGTAVVLFPVVRRYSGTAALGFVVTRVLEAGLILVGVVGVLAVVGVRDDLSGADPSSLVPVGTGLTAVHDATFLLGQSLMPVLNALFLGSVLYRSGLVPRLIPAIGLLGAPLLLASDIAVYWGAYGPSAPLAGLAALPVAAWELALGSWLVVKGFRPSPLLVHLDSRAGDRAARPEPAERVPDHA